MRKTTLFLVIIISLFTLLTPAEELYTAPLFQEYAGKQPLYTALLRYESPIFSDAELQNRIFYLGAGKRVDIYAVSPSRLLVGREGAIIGYINRDKLDDFTVENLQIDKIPNYPGVQNTYIGWVSETTPVPDRPSSTGGELITLNEGARLAFIGFEDGYGKLIFKKQYGYVDTRALSEIVPIDYLSEEPSLDYPIAAYTSFYNIATTENNLSRIKNLEVSCDKFEEITIKPGSNFDFNRDLGPYNARNGYFPAIVLVDGGSKLGYGGGTCQISSTLYNVTLQLPGINIDHRRPHGPRGIAYLPHGADAAVGNKKQNFIFTNNYPFPVRIEGSVQDGALTLAIWRTE